MFWILCLVALIAGVLVFVYWKQILEVIVPMVAGVIGLALLMFTLKHSDDNRRR